MPELVNVLILGTRIADGRERKDGTIAALAPDTAQALFGRGHGRAPSSEELVRLGVTPAADLAPGQGVRPPSAKSPEERKRLADAYAAKKASARQAPAGPAPGGTTGGTRPARQAPASVD